MRENLKVAVVVFFAVLIPITLWNVGQLYFTHSCDPKFGCFGTFSLLTYIVIFCAIISAISISAAHYIFVVRSKIKNTISSMAFLLLSCVLISVLSAFAISLAEYMGTFALIIIWGLVSFLVGSVVFKFGEKV